MVVGEGAEGSTGGVAMEAAPISRAGERRGGWRRRGGGGASAAAGEALVCKAKGEGAGHGGVGGGEGAGGELIGVWCRCVLGVGGGGN